jgi:hypothetical protein
MSSIGISQPNSGVGQAPISVNSNNAKVETASTHDEYSSCGGFRLARPDDAAGG